ncbi:hypothetical protein [uncultured Phenylobacterium sp.]|uniref:hypothetical protein n=1 Tax=uncultured Phenylobacterium sp. TaxID=349273 RepID=UPI0025D4DCA2|nr:hypothetical protein [uncultured Phenylobacterium sp.]
MRYGVVRASPDLPPPQAQRRLIEAQGCDVVLEARSLSPSGEQVLRRLLYSLKRGDQILVHGLEVFAVGVAGLARLFRYFHDSGVTVRLIGTAECLEPVGPAPRLLTLLADYAARHPDQPPTFRRARVAASPLTPHQLRYARDLQRRGESMRAIGLLFRLSPSEVAVLLARKPEPEDGGPRDATGAPSS